MNISLNVFVISIDFCFISNFVHFEDFLFTFPKFALPLILTVKLLLKLHPFNVTFDVFAPPLMKFCKRHLVPQIEHSWTTYNVVFMENVCS